jgi:hypothetical protein
LRPRRATLKVARLAVPFCTLLISGGAKSKSVLET